jgi:hypothetical protein
MPTDAETTGGAEARKTGHSFKTDQPNIARKFVIRLHCVQLWNVRNLGCSDALDRRRWTVYN